MTHNKRLAWEFFIWQVWVKAKMTALKMNNVKGLLSCRQPRFTVSIKGRCGVRRSLCPVYSIQSYLHLSNCTLRILIGDASKAALLTSTEMPYCPWWHFKAISGRPWIYLQQNSHRLQRCDGRELAYTKEGINAKWCTLLRHLLQM